MIYVILLALIIFILYSLYNPNKSVEGFSDGKSLLLDKVFKKNVDLAYFDKRSPMNFSDLQKIVTRQVAPIIDDLKGKAQKGMAKVAALPKEKTNRIPDKNSDDKSYSIPMPKYDDAQDRGLPLPKSKKVNKKNKKQIKGIKSKDNLEDAYKPNVLGNQCKFVSSFGILAKCPKDYPNETGAHLSSNRGQMLCNGKSPKIKGAEAVASIKNGKISDIKLTYSGERYTKSPKVHIRGDGKDALAVAKVGNGKVISVELISGGSGYKSTPQIVIDKPNVKLYCNLCCK